MNSLTYLVMAAASLGAVLIAGTVSAISANAESSMSSSMGSMNMGANNNSNNNGMSMSSGATTSANGSTDNSNNSMKTTRIMPTTQWISLKGIKLKPGEFLDLADTAPVPTTRGHVATYLPCDENGNTTISFVQGKVDVGVNTLKPVEPEYLKQLSTPGKNCMYHFDIGTPDGVTDFAIINNGTSAVTFGDRNTITMTFAEGLQKLG